MAEFNCRVFGIVTDSEARVLLLKRSVDYIPDTPDHCGWELVGGGLEYGEDPKAAIIREYQEEAGIEIAVDHLYQARTGSRDGKPLLNLGYICRYVRGDVTLTPEHTDFMWVDQKQFKEIDFGPYGNVDRDLYLSVIPGVGRGSL